MMVIVEWIGSERYQRSEPLDSRSYLRGYLGQRKRPDWIKSFTV